MSIIDTLIMDRTAEDVAKVAEYNRKGIDGMSADELAEWLAGLKGAYNAADLNRVNAAMAYLCERFDEIGYMVPGYEDQGITWSKQDIPRASQMAKYLSNVSAVRERIPLYQSTPPAPTSMNGLTYTGANAIEQIMADIEALIDCIIASWYFSGDLYGGEI